jgi:hypothetical protein
VLVESSSVFLPIISSPGAGRRVAGSDEILLTYVSMARIVRGCDALIIELTAAGIEPA